MKNDLTDLIDRNALLKKWDEKFFAMGADRLGPNGDEIMWYLNSLIDEIKNAPTVDLEEVEYKAFCDGVDRMKAEWINSQCSLKCSRCGYKDSRNNKANYNYCSNYGAEIQKGSAE